MRRGATLAFEDCLRLELRLAERIVRGSDFREGVRAEDEVDAQALVAGEAQLLVVPVGVAGGHERAHRVAEPGIEQRQRITVGLYFYTEATDPDLSKTPGP